MSACPRALGDGRYRWRHGRWPIQWMPPEVRPIYFVKAGECPAFACKINACLPSTAQDGQWRVDIGGTIEDSRADHNNNPATRFNSLLLIELTVPREENVDVACERKLKKYQELVEQCKCNKWRTACYPIEVGCHSFMGRSVCRILNQLGMIGEKKRKAIRTISESAKKACRRLWIKRSEPRSPTD